MPVCVRQKYHHCHFRTAVYIPASGTLTTSTKLALGTGPPPQKCKPWKPRDKTRISAQLGSFSGAHTQDYKHKTYHMQSSTISRPPLTHTQHQTHRQSRTTPTRPPLSHTEADSREAAADYLYTHRTRRAVAKDKQGKTAQEASTNTAMAAGQGDSRMDTGPENDSAQDIFPSGVRGTAVVPAVGTAESPLREVEFESSKRAV